MGYENLVVTREDRFVWITMNRPKVNALSLDLVRELREAVEAADADPAVRVILITGGEGRFFAAGADIPSLQSTLDAPTAPGTLLGEGLKTFERIVACETPVVAVVNGVALGGGCELALACHLRIAADSAIFGSPEINLGIIPGWGGTHRLARLIGVSRAHYWLMTARNYSAEECLASGLVSEVHPAAELADAARKMANVLADKPRVAMAETLAVLRECPDAPGQGQALETAAFERAARSVDAREGMAAFLEKRKPEFTGA
jgi:enoyl-CoA hydratase/carnithine racemase